MKFKNKIISLGLIGLLALGGVATATSFIIDAAEEINNTVHTDSALVVDWSGATIDNVENLNPGVPQYREVVINVSKSTSVAANVKVTFTLSGENTELIQVRISDSSFQSQEETQTIKTINNETKSDFFTFNAAIVESKTYYLEFSAIASSEGTILGNLNVALSNESTVTE